MLEKLHDKFEDERTDLEKEESNARHAYEMSPRALASDPVAARKQFNSMPCEQF